MTDESPFMNVPPPPDHVSASAVVTRAIDGLGFRFYWATKGLEEKDYEFQPGPEIMTIKEIVTHIWNMSYWVSASVSGLQDERPDGIDEIRNGVLEKLYHLRNAFASMSNEDLTNIEIEGLPFWNIINGPLSDALTHVGQINSFRRLAGNPSPKINHFKGHAPEQTT